MINLYHSTCANFGDALSPRLIEHLLGRKTESASFDRAELVGVGSVLFSGSALFSEHYPLCSVQGVRSRLATVRGLANPVLKIWGTGFLTPRPAKNPDVRRRVKLLATRGKFTRDILIAQGVVPSGTNCALGDPGLLYRELLPKMPAKQYDVGLVPHMTDRVVANYVYEKIAATGRKVKYIHVEDDPIQVLFDIASCETILSSSLHGLIVADSIGIPNAHLILSHLGLSEEDFMFKFRDYYSAFGLEVPAFVGLKDIIENTHDVCSRCMCKQNVSQSAISEVADRLKQVLVQEFCSGR